MAERAPARPPPRAHARLGCSSSTPARREARADRGRHPRHRARLSRTGGGLGLRRATGTTPSTTAGTRTAARDIVADVAARAGRRRRRWRDEVEALVRVHEEGGWPEADLVQAADSLSFLETMVPLVVGWVQAGRGAARARRGQGCATRSSASARDLPRGARGWPRPLLGAGAVSALRRRATRPARCSRRRGLVRDGPHVPRSRASASRGMPLFPGHPDASRCSSYRTPQGIRAAGDQPWGPPQRRRPRLHERAGDGHDRTRGAHIDAHAHMTIGAEDRWHGGSARDRPRRLRAADAATPPRSRRCGGAACSTTCRATAASTSLAAGEPVGADELRGDRGGAPASRRARATSRSSAPATSRHWPDPERARRATAAPGPDLSAARLLAERGVVAVGSDTETFEVQPAPDPRRAGQPAARAHAAADRARHLHHGEPRPRGARRARACASSCSSRCRWRSAARPAR